MRLLFVMHPVDNLDASVEQFRSVGLQTIYWPDDDAVLLGAAATGPPTIMLCHRPSESEVGCGGVFAVADVDDFFTRHPRLDWHQPPGDWCLGRYAVYLDRTALPVRLLDYTRDRVARSILARSPQPLTRSS